MNLAEFPLAVLSTRANPNLKTLEFTDTHRSPSGELVERRWIITGADKFGLPTSTDDDVVLGLIRLSMSKGFRERKVYFTRYELLKTLRWSTEGRSYQRLVKSLDRLSGVRIRSTNSFYDNSSKAYQTCNFGIIDAYEINDGRGRLQLEEETPKSFFIWSEALFTSFKAGYIKKLDLDLYFSLKSAVSRRLYRYLDKHFYYKTSIERPLVQFAFEKLGLSRTYRFVSSIRQQMEPALQELVEIGFLSKYEFVGKSTATCIRFFSASHVSVPSIQTVVDQQRNSLFNEKEKSGEKIRLQVSKQEEDFKVIQFEELVKRGIAKGAATRLVKNILPSQNKKFNSLLRYYDALVANSDYKVSKNREGFLYRAVENIEEFNVPEQFLDPLLKTVVKQRPELKLFKQVDQVDSFRKQEYNNYINSRLAEALAKMSEEIVLELRNKVEKKMICLKGVLAPEKYAEAIDGCVREDLKKQLNLPNYLVWQEQL
jgi:Replication initiator protein A